MCVYLCVCVCVCVHMRGCSCACTVPSAGLIKDLACSFCSFFCIDNIPSVASMQRAVYINIVSDLNCGVIAYSFKGLVQMLEVCVCVCVCVVGGSVLDVITQGRKLLRGDNVTTPLSPAAGSTVSRYSQGQVNPCLWLITAKLK